MAISPCNSDPSEILEAITGVKSAEAAFEAQLQQAADASLDNADKFDKFVNGGVTEEVQLGAGQPTPTLRNVVHLVKSAAAELDDSDVSGKFSDAANGGTELRMLSERFGDLVNIRDFGAVGDGTTNDTTAWTAWQTALASGGIGYIPAGDYLVSGTVKHFAHGCLGNGTDLVWDAYMNSAPSPETNWPHGGTTGPIVKYYKQYGAPTTWSPQIDLSFDCVCNSTPTLTSHGNGPVGLEVRGTSKGSCNLTMPVGVRSVIENCLNGDGDAVAIWGRTKKTDPAGGTNNSDSCAGHFSTICSSVGTGISMATEHVAVCDKDQGEEGTEFANFFDPGGIVAEHVILNGNKGMVQSGILFNGTSASPYGSWAAIVFNNNIFKYNNSALFPENTTILKAFTFNTENSPESFMWLGYCPKHVRMVGSYGFNFFADNVSLHSNTVDGSPFFEAIDQLKYDPDDPDDPDKPSTPATPWVGFRISGATCGSSRHVPNVGSTKTVYFDLYHERNNPIIFYRARGAQGTAHQFYCTASDSASLNSYPSLVVNANGCFPGSDNTVKLGSTSFRWSEVFAATGSITTSDERVKDNIEAPSDALMRAWGKVNFKVFQFKDAIAQKGSENARLHVGVIAQHVIAAFAEEGLDATRYGLLCHDSWDAIEPHEQREWVEDEPERRDDDGNLIKEAVGHYNVIVEQAREAGDIYSIRYDEALALECAYQRWRLEQIEARLNGISGNGPAPSGASPDNL